MNSDHDPATKADIRALDEKVSALDEKLQATKDQLVEAFRDIQTELLKAFYSFAESNRQRVTQLEFNEAALIARVGTLEDRLLTLERKVNFPNHPAS